jgi:hypothetical protein
MSNARKMLQIFSTMLYRILAETETLANIFNKLLQYQIELLGNCYI